MVELYVQRKHRRRQVCFRVHDRSCLIVYSTVVMAYAILLRKGGPMIDPIQVPILLKAIDFVFEEGRKILEERRERRKAGDGTPQVEKAETQKEIVPLPVEQLKEVKRDLLASKIDDLSWLNHEEEVQH